MLSVVPFAPTICFFVAVIWPLYSSAEALYQKDRATITELSQWVAYWIIFILFTYVEKYLLFWIVEWIPLYTEMKILMFFWLCYQDFYGAGWLWFEHARVPFSKVDSVVNEFIDRRLGALMTFALGASSQNQSGASTSNNKKFNEARESPVSASPAGGVHRD